jgi:hypothetical protein
MSESVMLAGSLSNDLFRVAMMIQRGSDKAASRFLQEAKRWSGDLEKSKDVKDYIINIARDINQRSITDLSESSGEQYLMYGVDLQNYCLHNSL